MRMTGDPIWDMTDKEWEEEQRRTWGEGEAASPGPQRSEGPVKRLVGTPPCTRQEFLESVEEMYREWLKHEGVKSLPDFEEALEYVKQYGLPE